MDAQDSAAAGSEGHDTGGPNTDQAMTRSEEQLHVGTERQETGRARLRKHIVTEQTTVTVPVQREEVRVEREPITDENRGQAMSGDELSEEEHEVTLHEERPVVQKETVPVERVKLTTETTTDRVEVNEDVRNEQIVTDGVDDTPSANPPSVGRSVGANQAPAARPSRSQPARVQQVADVARARRGWSE